MCKGTGWIEILGAGMVNPKVLDMCGLIVKNIKVLHLELESNVLLC